MSAREALERDLATAPPWQRRLIFGLRWPVRLIYALSGGIVILEIPISAGILLAAKILVVAISVWFALAEGVKALHMSFDVPGFMPAWARRVMRISVSPVRYGVMLAAPLMALVPIILVFPSLRGTTVADILLALILIGLAGMVPMLLLVAGMVLALPIIIPIGVVRSIRDRRNRRYREIYRYMGRPPW